MSRPVYRLVDHTADIAFAVEAPTWPALLEAATAAVSDVILAFTDERLDEERRVEVAGADREDVLVAWLTEVVVLLEDERFLAREARLERADATGARGLLCGRRLDEGVEPPDRVVKAVTYHDLAILEGSGNTPWSATVVLDL